MGMSAVSKIPVAFGSNCWAEIYHQLPTPVSLSLSES